MKQILFVQCIAGLMFMASCNQQDASKADATATSPESGTTVGQSAVQDDESQKNVVQVAIASPDHSTLVKAVQQAELVDALSNAGPFTVFAPTNEAFNKLPAGTLDGLMKPDQKNALSNILEYHVSLGVFKPEALTDGLSLGQVNGGNVTISVKDGNVYVGDARVVASVPASNGIVHVIDAVLLPPSK